jgi:hypothetical protein
MTDSSASCQTAVACVAVEAMAHARHQRLSVPDLAVRVLAMAGVRRVDVNNDADSDAVAAAVRLLRDGPFNASELTLTGLSSGDLRTLFGGLAACHGQLRGLTVTGSFDDFGVTTFTDADADVVRAGAGGLRHLRRLEAFASGGLAIAAATQSTLRRLSLGHAPGATLELSAHAALRCAELHHLPELATLNLPGALATLSVFGCGELTAVVLPRSLTALTVMYCENLASLDLSRTGVTSIAESFLRSCPAVTAVALPSSITRVDRLAFSGCTALRAIDLSHTQVACIDDMFLYECENITSALLPGTLTHLGCDAFNGCAALATIDMSHTVVGFVGEGFGRGCHALVSVALPAALPDVGVVTHKALATAVARRE